MLCLILVEAIADSLLRSFASAHVLKLLEKTESGNEAYLLNFVETVVMAWHAQAIPESMPESFNPFRAAMSKIERWCKTVLALLSPIPRHLDSDIAMYDDLVKSSDFMDTELRDAVRDNPFWQQKLKAAQASASADAEFAGEIADLFQTLKKAENLVQCMDAARLSLQARSNMVEHLRPGALKQLDEVVLRKLLFIADNVLGAEANASKLAIDCDWLVQSLGSLSVSSEAVPAVLVSLAQWKEANFGILLMNEMAELAQKVSETDVQVQEVQRILEQLMLKYEDMDVAMQDHVNVSVAACLGAISVKASLIALHVTVSLL